MDLERRWSPKGKSRQVARFADWSSGREDSEWKRGREEKKKWMEKEEEEEEMETEKEGEERREVMR